MKRIDWQALRATVDGRETYRRAGLLLGGAVLIYALWQNWIMDPLQQQTGLLSTQAAAVEQDIANLRARVAVLEAAREDDPDAALSRQAHALEQQLQGMDDELRELTGTLLPPGRMAAAIESVLVQNTPLRLTALKGLGSEPVLSPAPGSAEGGSGQPLLYRHGLRLQFEGAYLDALDYLKALEELPWHFSWDSLSLAVTDYPVSRVSLELSTLSLNPVWISL